MKQAQIDCIVGRLIYDYYFDCNPTELFRVVQLHFSGRCIVEIDDATAEMVSLYGGKYRYIPA